MNRQTKNTNLKRLPFDQYSRQYRASQLIDSLRDKGAPVTILDVGGYKGATALFHPIDSVTVLDVFDVDEPNYIQGDATEMTFENDSFDFVVSFDVFEHIPRSKREAFVRECARVAKRGVIIAAPVGTSSNAVAEVQVNELYKQLHGHDHQWLQEHITYKLPEPNLADKLMSENELHTMSFSSNYLPAWALMQSTIFGASKFDVVGKRIDDLYEEYNNLLPSDGTPESNENYRSVVLGVKSNKDIATIRAKVTDIFMSKEEYFNNYVKLNLVIAKVLVHAMDELFIANEDHLKQFLEVQALKDGLSAENLGLVQKLAQQKQMYDTVISSKVYRYGRIISKILHAPKKALKGTKV